MHTKMHRVSCSFSSTKVHWNFGVLQQYGKFGVLFVFIRNILVAVKARPGREMRAIGLLGVGFPETIPNHILHFPGLVLKMFACLTYPHILPVPTLTHF